MSNTTTPQISQKEQPTNSITSLIRREKELFINQQDTTIYAFDTVLNTIVSNQNRIIALEETLANHQEEITFLQDIINSLEYELHQKEESWKRSLQNKEIELKKYQIQLEQIVPEILRSRNEKIIDLQHKIELLEEIIRCKDSVISSMSIELP